MVEVADIEKRIDTVIAGGVTVNAELGGLSLETMAQVMEFAKLMAVSGAAVPKWLRGNPGGCLAICSRALRWKADPFAVAEKSYMVMNKGEERIAFEAQLIHAVVTSLAPLKQRLRHEIIGKNGERRCRVWGTFKGEDKPHEYISETLDKMLAGRPKRRDDSGYGGSPLWETQPEVQLAYSTYRQWCRLFSSETLLGIYARDELEDEPIDVTPPASTPSSVTALAQRLRDAKAHAGGRGFDLTHVKNEASMRTTIEGDAASVAQQEKTDEGTEGSGSVSGTEGRSSDARRGSDDDQREAGRNRSGEGDPRDGAASAGHAPARAAQVEARGTAKPQAKRK